MAKKWFCLVIFLGGCSSYFKRQACNEINWFQHGYKVAMGGQRLNSDTQVKQCEKVEAEVNWSELDLGFKSGMSNYCKPEVVLTTGKKGEFLNTDLCDDSEITVLKSKHAEGVRMFCLPDSGYSFGASGKKYNQICPKDLEPKFIPRYKRGRRVFLQGQIQNKRGRIREKQQRISRLRYEIRNVEGKISSHAYRRPKEKVSQYNPLTKMTEQKRNENYDHWKRRQNELKRKKEDLRGQLRRQESEVETLNSEVDGMSVELGGLN